VGEVDSVVPSPRERGEGTFMSTVRATTSPSGAGGADRASAQVHRGDVVRAIGALLPRPGSRVFVPDWPAGRQSSSQ
jgi:hypothetical protein